MKLKRFMERPAVDEGRSSHRSRGGFTVRDSQDRRVKPNVGTSNYLPAVVVKDPTVTNDSTKYQGRPGKPGAGRARPSFKQFGRT